MELAIVLGAFTTLVSAVMGYVTYRMAKGEFDVLFSIWPFPIRLPRTKKEKEKEAAAAARSAAIAAIARTLPISVGIPGFRIQFSPKQLEAIAVHHPEAIKELNEDSVMRVLDAVPLADLSPQLIRRLSQLPEKPPADEHGQR